MPKVSYYDFLGAKCDVTCGPINCICEEPELFNFEVKIVDLECLWDARVIWEFSCGCCVKFPNQRRSDAFLKDMKIFYDGRPVRKTRFLLSSAKTDHLICRKNPDMFGLLVEVSLGDQFKAAVLNRILTIYNYDPASDPEEQDQWKTSMKVANPKRKPTIDEIQLDLYRQPAKKQKRN